MLNATFDASWLVITLFVVDLVVRIAAIIIVPRNRRPTAAMAWLLAIFLLPYVIEKAATAPVLMLLGAIIAVVCGLLRCYFTESE